MENTTNTIPQSTTNNAPTGNTEPTVPTLEEALQLVKEANTELAAIKKKIAEDAGVTWDYADQTEEKSEVRITSANPWDWSREALPRITESPIYQAVVKGYGVSPKEAQLSYKEIGRTAELIVNIIQNPDPQKVMEYFFNWQEAHPQKSYPAVNHELQKELFYQQMKRDRQGVSK